LETEDRSLSSTLASEPGSTYAAEIRILLTETVRRWRYVVIAGVAGALAGFALSWTVATPFEAEAMLLVRPASAQGAAAGISLMEGLLQNRETARAALKEEGPPDLTGVAYLAKHQRVENLPGTFMIRLSVRGEDPNWTARIANKVASLAVETSKRVLERHPALRERREQLSRDLDRARAALAAAPLPDPPPAGFPETADHLRQRLEYERLSRHVEELSRRLVQFETELDLTGADLVVIDPAVPPVARIPRHTGVDTGLGALLGGCLGLAAAALAGLWRAVGANVA
jgi:uncharacterized protein involved in exopolysaccharide biosynthesis